MDSDLFSSTLYVLSKLKKIIKKNVIIRFDDFGYLDDKSEFLAFRDFVRDFNKNFEIVLGDKWYSHITIRII